MKYFILTIFIFLSLFSFSQTKIDSLENLLKGKLENEKKVEILNELCIKYRRKSLDKSSEYGKQAVEFSLRTSGDEAVYDSYSNYGKTFLYKGEYANALKQYKQALIFSKKTKKEMLIGQALHNMGNSYLYLTQYEKAISMYIDALKIRERINDEEGIAATTNNIGTIYWNLHDNKKALKYFTQSLNYEKKLKNKDGIASSLNNIGLIYWKQGKFLLDHIDSDSIKDTVLVKKQAFTHLDTALQYLEESSRIKKEIGARKRKILTTLNNIGVIYRTKKNYSKALKYFNEALDMALETNSKNDLANSYNNIALIHEMRKNYKASVEYGEKALKIAKEINSIKIISEVLSVLNYSYSKMGKYEKAYKLQNDAIMYKDTLFTSKNDKLMSEMESKYSSEKKEKELKIQKLELKQQEAENKTKSYIIYAFAVFFVLIIIFSIALLRQIRAKKKANEILVLKNAEITQHKEEIQTQADNLELVNEQISEKNRIIEYANESLNSSIRYALTIQQALLPVEENFSKFYENFVIYKPKDIVSGDFYWFSHVITSENKAYDFWIIVDCTGHGVPGAFMSMVGERLINEIINEKNIYSPAGILTELNLRVRKALKQDQNENRDGMDVCLCRIEKTNDNAQICYAGAKRDLYIYKNETKEIEIIKGTRKSIGGVVSRTNKEFTETNITVLKTDVLYFSTDGFIDQSNTERTRLGSANFIKLLSENGAKNLDKQKIILEKALSEHMQEEKQRDDITVIAVKI